jgi:hypothetical protein
MSLRFNGYVSEKLAGTIYNIATSEGRLQERLAAGFREFAGLTETDFHRPSDRADFLKIRTSMLQHSKLDEQEVRNVIDDLLLLRRKVFEALTEFSCYEQIIGDFTETRTQGPAGERSRKILEALNNVRSLLRESKNLAEVSAELHKISTLSGQGWDRQFGGHALKLSQSMKISPGEHCPDQLDCEIQKLMIAACFVK